jgi:hypothetical protein
MKYQILYLKFHMMAFICYRWLNVNADTENSQHGKKPDGEGGAQPVGGGL